MLQKTTAQKKIASLRKRIRIVRGGTSSSKTYSIIPLLITYALQIPKKRISIVSESVPHLKRGAIRDFIKIMSDTDLLDYNQYNRSSMTYYFKNGSYIEFFSADQPNKLRGARRDVLFINECNNVDFESFQQLQIRTEDFIYLDYNPVREFWVDTELIGQDNSEMIVLTFQDNEALSPSIRNEILKAKEKAKKSEYWENWWRVYGLGEIGTLQGAVFTNWIQGEFNPDNLQTSFGQDYGFSNDPTTLVEVAIDRKKSIIYVKECLYQTGLTSTQIAEANLKHAKRKLIVADSAEPRLITELAQKGCNVQGTIKGKGSIEAGIMKMQDYKIIVDPKSANIIKEFNNHIYADKGSKLFMDTFNHAIDAIRYNVMFHLSGDYGIIIA